MTRAVVGLWELPCAPQEKFQRCGAVVDLEAPLTLLQHRDALAELVRCECTRFEVGEQTAELIGDARRALAVLQVCVKMFRERRQRVVWIDVVGREVRRAGRACLLHVQMLRWSSRDR